MALPVREWDDNEEAKLSAGSTLGRLLEGAERLKTGTTDAYIEALRHVTQAAVREAVEEACATPTPPRAKEGV